MMSLFQSVLIFLYRVRIDGYIATYSRIVCQTMLMSNYAYVSLNVLPDLKFYETILFLY